MEPFTKSFIFEKFPDIQKVKNNPNYAREINLPTN